METLKTDGIDKTSQIGIGRAIKETISKSRSGEAFDPNELGQETLLALKRLVDEMVKWRAIPNENKGGH